MVSPRENVRKLETQDDYLEHWKDIAEELAKEPVVDKEYKE